LRPRTFAIGAGGIALVLTAMLVVGWWRTEGAQGGRSQSVLPASLAAMDFRLVDHLGRAARPSDWIGRPTIVFFGFTWCPDICPTTLADISGWLAELGDEAADLNVAFITVDPERDSAEVLAEYIRAFDPRIVAYTGPPEDIADAADRFGVQIEKVAGNDGDYAVNHTASVFLYRADGRFSGTIDYHESGEFALPKLRRLLGA
jgi:protein SCO1/2